MCDEPTSALDVSVQAQILNLMRRLQDKFGLTYLFISHNLSVVRHMSDAIAIMYLGRFVETGPAEEIFSAPRHPYTRLLLETIPNVETPNRSRRALSGEVPNPIAPPSGCPFHPRCAQAEEQCPNWSDTIARSPAAWSGLTERQPGTSVPGRPARYLRMQICRPAVSGSLQCCPPLAWA